MRCTLIQFVISTGMGRCTLWSSIMSGAFPVSLHQLTLRLTSVRIVIRAEGGAMARSYRDRDYSFGQMILNLRSAIGFTQAGLAEQLGISRFAVGEWEAGNKYPKAESLKVFIELAVQQGAFPAGYEADKIRDLWKAAHQKLLLDEKWLAGLLASKPGVENGGKVVNTRS